MGALEILLLAFVLIFLVIVIVNMDRNYRKNENESILKRLRGKKTGDPS